jgi:hypothetical protein
MFKAVLHGSGRLLPGSIREIPPVGCHHEEHLVV